jgi:hypothetical protein
MTLGRQGWNHAPALDAADDHVEESSETEEEEMLTPQPNTDGEALLSPKAGRHLAEDFATMVSINESLREGWMSKYDRGFLPSSPKDVVKKTKTIHIEIPEYKSDDEKDINFLENIEDGKSKDILRKMFEFFSVPYIQKEQTLPRRPPINYTMPIPEQPKNVLSARRFSRRYSSGFRKEITLDPPKGFDDSSRLHYLKLRAVLNNSLFVTPQLCELDELLGVS